MLTYACAIIQEATVSVALKYFEYSECHSPSGRDIGLSQGLTKIPITSTRAGES